MLLLYLQDYIRDHRERLEALCRRELFQNDWEARIACCEETASGVAARLGESPVPALFILDGAMDREPELQDLVRRLRRQNPANYLVLLLGALSHALEIRPSYYRTAGYLVRPVEGDYLARLLAEIYKDYRGSGLEEGEVFLAKIKNTEYPLSYGKIIFFESASKKVIARTAGQEYSFYDSLERIAAAAPDYFMRIHKSYCVNLRLVKQVDYTAMAVTMADDSLVYLSRGSKKTLRERLSALVTGGGGG